MNTKRKTSYTKRTSDLYGKYSFGNMYDKLFSEIGLEDTRKNSVLRDLKSSDVTLEELKKYHVMDVGTGRQAYSFLSLGAKAIDHYDISKDHVKRFKSFLRGKDYPITTTNANLCEYKLPVQKYDYVYLSGIVHHFENTAVGLKNCAEATKMGGKIWVQFYRSGTLYWFIVQMMRELAEYEELENFFLSSALIYADGDTSNDITSNLMDDLYVPSINLYPPLEYQEFMSLCGFEVCAEVNIKPVGNLNLLTAYHTGIFAFKRVREVDLSKLDTGKLLMPENSVDQLSVTFHKNKDAIKAIKLFYELKNDLKKTKNANVKFALMIALHRLYITKTKFIKKPNLYLKETKNNLKKINFILSSISKIFPK